MKYVKAEMVLPEQLLREVQKYMNGVMMYVPKQEGDRKGWGVKSGGRQKLEQRNCEIRELFSQGATIDQLTERYYLSCETIKKIVYARMNRRL
ncbi:CD3324 family protein [Paenibacillus harenae]|uniref:Mor family transcriptional regulator n=1 Tax=Paenibacillus harenae TaxID=306543 RepID=A0ABT9UA52_PAEHA|nr:CD3324 family protein [Paenibacillus harenae]MDQ0116541.1 Mor family transcriptional regulator [Paenibacillus harenae]